MRKTVCVAALILFACSVYAVKVRTYRQHERVGWASYGMATVGSVVAGATSWGGYLLWSWGSKALTPESWDPTLEVIGQGGLYGLGYGLFIPAGASTGVVSVAIGAGEEHHSWGAVLGSYVGSAASLPFAVMAIRDPSWGKASLAAGSIIILPPLCSWAAYHLTPRRGRSQATLPFQPVPYLLSNGEEISAGLSIRF